MGFNPVPNEGLNVLLRSATPTAAPGESQNGGELPGQQSPFPTQSTSDQQTNSSNRQITNFLQQQRSIFQQRSPTPPNFDRDINAHRQLDNSNPPSNRNNAKGPKVKLKDNEHLFNQLKVASHNINGLQSNQTKWNSLLDWTNDNKYDIVGIAESNLTTRQCTFLLPHIDDYSVVWLGKDINKIKGSGVGIIIHNKWEKHMGKKLFIDHYLIHLTLFFKGCKFSIIQVYVSPNDARIQEQIHKHLLQHIESTDNDNNHHTIIMGDLNSINSRFLDIECNNNNTSASTSNRKPSKLIRSLNSKNYTDSFRFLHPHTKKFTWHHDAYSYHNNSNCNCTTSASRIDYIWTSPCSKPYLVHADIIQANLITSSDHEITIHRLDTTWKPHGTSQYTLNRPTALT